MEIVANQYGEFCKVAIKKAGIINPYNHGFKGISLQRHFDLIFNVLLSEINNYELDITGRMQFIEMAYEVFNTYRGIYNVSFRIQRSKG